MQIITKNYLENNFEIKLTKLVFSIMKTKF